MSSAAARAGVPRTPVRSAGRAPSRGRVGAAARTAMGAAAAARAPGQPPARPAGTARRRPSLRLVPQGRRRVARAPFIGVVVAILGAGLLGLLGLNTVLAQGSFHLHALQVSNKQLADREQVLRREVDALQAPAALAAQAQAQGMVPGGPPVFLRLPDGTVLGEPAAASPAPTPVAPEPAVDVPRPDAASPGAEAPTAKPGAEAPTTKPGAEAPTTKPGAKTPTTKAAR